VPQVEGLLKLQLKMNREGAYSSAPMQKSVPAAGQACVVTGSLVTVGVQKHVMGHMRISAVPLTL
jgi:hypothetical protein